jgi:hypothetical protein
MKDAEYETSTTSWFGICFAEPKLCTIDRTCRNAFSGGLFVSPGAVPGLGVGRPKPTPMYAVPVSVTHG